MTNPACAWLAEFRLMNLELRRTLDGRPLYSYQVTQSEYQQLNLILQKKPIMSGNSIHLTDWAACFCLYVSENFRREYEGSWSWDPIWTNLGYELPVQDYQRLVELGLKKWNRPMRYFAKGRNFLGSLFGEGGLPWQLVQTDHGFGVIVRKGLAEYYNTKAVGQPLTLLMSDYANRLPQSFRNLETYQLLAGIVEQLIYLVESYPIQDQLDPASYLDQNKPTWRSEFPIPLDEDNARNLINEWLKTANEQHKQQAQKSKDIQVLYCTHLLNNFDPDVNNWKIQTSVYLPKKIELLIDCAHLTSTRFELAFYEGERMIKKAGVAYAEIDHQNNKVVVSILSQKFDFNRHAVNEPVKLCFFQSGINRHSILIDDSALMIGELPVVFECKNDEWLFLRQASCKTTSNMVCVNTPAHCKIIFGDYSVLGKLADGSQWVKFTSDATLLIDSDRYRIRLQQTINDATARVVGQVCLYNTVPSLVYYGLPQVRVDGQADIPSHWSVEMNGKPLILPIRQRNEGFAGLVDYRVLGEEKENLVRQRFGVLPVGFSIVSRPSSGRVPAKLIIKQAQAMPVSIAEDSIVSSKIETSEGVEIYMTPKHDTRPTIVTLLVGSPNAPIRIILPYPYEGAELINEHQIRVDSTELSLDELLGLRLNINNANQIQQKAILELSLVRYTGYTIKRSFETDSYHSAISISLFNYQEEILQLLSSAEDQDAYVQIGIIQSGKLLKQLNIRRYQSVMKKVSSQRFSLEYAAPRLEGDQLVKFRAMLLSNPKQQIDIPTIYSHGAATGEYEVSAELEREGPWLIFSTHDSTSKTRPFLYVSLNSDPVENESSLSIKSLHHAAQLFHPFHRPNLISQQIKKMSENLSHSGWQYLSDLKTDYQHLALSTFEVWRELARQPLALALGLFKLEFDYSFCERIKQELAVLWDTISIQVWVTAYAQFKLWLSEQGIPDVLIAQILENREQTLLGIVSGFEFTRSYLQAPLYRNLLPAPLEVLSFWYQELRQRNAQENSWPSELGASIKDWIFKQDLPPAIKNLSLIEETDAVAYLPIFMAFVSTERATFQDLNFPLENVKFQISLTADFDRVAWYSPVHALMVCYLLGKSQPAN